MLAMPLILRWSVHKPIANNDAIVIMFCLYAGYTTYRIAGVFLSRSQRRQQGH